MASTVILTGLACGALLTGAVLALWDGLRPAPGFSRAVRVIRSGAATLIAIGAVLAWPGDQFISRRALHVLLMAAVATPPGFHRRGLSGWSHALLILPALALTATGVFWISTPVEADARSVSVTLAELALAICGGLGARVLGIALSEAIMRSPPDVWTAKATYALLTLIVGGTALTNLWQRGTMWIGTAGESGLAGAWLAWSAARVGPRQATRLQAVLVTIATLSLVILAAGYPITGLN